MNILYQYFGSYYAITIYFVLKYTLHIYICSKSRDDNVIVQCSYACRMITNDFWSLFCNEKRVAIQYENRILILYLNENHSKVIKFVVTILFWFVLFKVMFILQCCWCLFSWAFLFYVYLVGLLLICSLPLLSLLFTSFSILFRLNVHRAGTHNYLFVTFAKYSLYVTYS